VQQHEHRFLFILHEEDVLKLKVDSCGKIILPKLHKNSTKDIQLFHCCIFV